ncbi:hypothetical protein [Ornithinimicrobium kibberense]|uniref:hypothetical protein n=1 Tax=Ornithinimicrobium kibberense TaxID=282060 RepID=UPI0036140122
MSPGCSFRQGSRFIDELVLRDVVIITPHDGSMPYRTAQEGRIVGSDRIPEVWSQPRSSHENPHPPADLRCARCGDHERLRRHSRGRRPGRPSGRGGVRTGAAPSRLWPRGGTAHRTGILCRQSRGLRAASR